MTTSQQGATQVWPFLPWSRHTFLRQTISLTLVCQLLSSYFLETTQEGTNLQVTRCNLGWVLPFPVASDTHIPLESADFGPARSSLASL